VKILGLACGRKLGNSEVLVREALMSAEQNGAEIELIRAMDLYIKPCVGCESCAYDRMAGGDGVCVIKDDHIPFLMQKVSECDGLIIGSPCYSGRPSGYLLMIEDRFMSMPVSYRKKMLAKPVVKAVIGVGGTEIVGNMLPLLSKFQKENLTLVDQMMVVWTSRPNQVVLNDEALARARKLGQNIVNATKCSAENIKFMGETASQNLGDYHRSDYDINTQLSHIFEACPVCHSDLIRLRGDFVECPVCYTRGSVEVTDGIARFVCDPVNKPSLYSGDAGFKRHDEDGIAVANRLVQEKKSEIQEKMKKYKDNLIATKPPLLK